MPTLSSPIVRRFAASRAARHFSNRSIILSKPVIDMGLDDLLVDAKVIGADFDTMTGVTRPAAFVTKFNYKGEVIPGDIQPPDLLDPTYRQKAGFFSTFSDWAASEIVRWSGKESSGYAFIDKMKKLGAYKEKDVVFHYRKIGLDAVEMGKTRDKLKKDASDAFAAISQGGKASIRVFMTGAAGFIGQDFCQRVAEDDEVKSVTGVILKEELGGLPLDQWTTLFLDRLDIPRSVHSKYDFVLGDCEKPLLGLTLQVIEKYKTTITHFAHLAASVSFEDPYNYMYGKNVLATQYALEVASMIQNHPGSPFVNAIFTETCYIHGRRKPNEGKEAELQFPNDYYNNYYELTKALGDVIAMEACYQKGLRVIACCPAIVIGNSRDGNNHGDRKVVNAACNAFGRIFEELQKLPQPFKFIVLRNVLAFPGSAQVTMNISPVDRIVDGLQAALRKPGATGERIHLGCGGVNTGRLAEIYRDEIGIPVRYVNPVIHRVIRRRVLEVMFKLIGQAKLYKRLEILFNIFGGYAEWGQPKHELGNDVRLLGLSEKRPNLEQVLRLMSRHNKHVQGWGQVRDRDEIARREKIWKKFIADMEKKTGKGIKDIEPAVFHKAFADAKPF
jgi:nucleoside-diphosphate-sugar epimerase